MKISKFIAVIVALSSPCLAAQEQVTPIHPQMNATHIFILGGFRQDADAKFYVDVDAVQLPKDEIDLGDLGMDETDTSWLAEYRYRISEKWMLSLAGYTFNTGGSIQAGRTFEYDGVEFEAGLKIDSSLQTDTYMAEILYKIYGNERAQLFIGGGLHVTKITTELKATVSVGDQSGSRLRAGDDILAPLPNLRVQGTYAFNPRWTVAGTLGWLSLSYDDYEGSFGYFIGRVNYRLTDRFGVGLGYQYLDMDFSVKRGNGEAGVDIQFNGPSAYLTYSF